MIDIETLKANGAKPIHITSKGEIFIGGDKFPYPVDAVGVSVKQYRRDRLNLLTLTFVCGDVQIDQRQTPKTEEGEGDS